VKRYGRFPTAEAAYEALRRVATRSAGQRWFVTVASGRRAPLARVLAAYRLGRLLAPEEHVHHIDHNPDNEHPSNLQVIDAADHRLHHGYLGLSLGRKVAPLLVAPGKVRNFRRVVMEHFLGRKLRRNELVVNRNGDRLDNRPSNLRLITKREFCALLGRVYGRAGAKATNAKLRAQRQDGGSLAGAAGEVARRGGPQDAAGSHQAD